MEVKLDHVEIASAIYIYLALKGYKADVSTMRTGIKDSMFYPTSLEYIKMECQNFERPVDPQKIHRLVKEGKL